MGVALDPETVVQHVKASGTLDATRSVFLIGARRGRVRISQLGLGLGVGLSWDFFLRFALDDTVDETPVDPQTDAHWEFGAPVRGRFMNSRALEDINSASPFFANLDFRLRQFISDEFPEEHIKFEDTIMVCAEFLIRLFKCLYISYQSMEDWHGARDIVRCNPCFHQRPRYDCILVNFTDPGLHFARSRWKPRTRWAGCQIREEANDSSFLSMEHVVRGALPAPVSAASDESTHILIDTVDADIFL
ncbi:hypothetical protein C8R45DRAFT_936699 [Mycena sanguinolenta]|nr:hypothetical protein C8R45DRAFT_936699 [Mycena sanguinolenta]